jgi:hypothetical protein
MGERFVYLFEKPVTFFFCVVALVDPLKTAANEKRPARPGGQISKEAKLWPIIRDSKYGFLGRTFAQKVLRALWARLR